MDRPSVRLLVAAMTLLALGAGARADRIELADGRVLEGRFTFADGVAGDPFADEEEGERPSGPILVCDDGLTRTMVSKRQVVRVEPAPVDLGMERLSIPQRIPNTGRRVAGMGAPLEATPFDEFGRRILALATAEGRIDVVQGITEITPRWVRIQGVETERPLLLDMRVATSSIPLDVLRRVIASHLDRRDSEQRLRLVRLLLQSERYEDAARELDAVLADFPDLADLARERAGLARLSAARLFDEIRLRGRAGQDRRAIGLLETFPADGADVETLEAVREARDDYRARRERAAALVDELRRRVSRLGDATDRTAAGAVADEIERGLTFATLGRLATFERVGLGDDVPPDRAVALAVSGWLGAGGGDNLKVALSAVRVRSLIRDHLAAPDAAARGRALAAIRNEEAGDAATIAAVAAGMRPPLDAPAATTPGLHELEVPALDEAAPLRCLVQLPPEYDPLRRYPAIVSLHGTGSTPEAQVEWWAGPRDAEGERRGQAGRHGFIVVAPAWSRPGQSGCEYSAREHAAVLAAVRESARRFAIDTDRVFLTGHALGGDVAWDVALAHPDLWAGVVLVTPTADRYVTHYSPNARTLPFYVVGGELDGACLQRNAVDLDRYLTKGFDATYVEYRGRGHEHFSDEILRIFDWLGRKRRTFFPAEIKAVSYRPWDRFFWWLEMEGAPPRTIVLPTDWPPPPNTRPCAVEGKTTATNGITAHCGADRVRVWLSPELVDFDRPVTVTLDGTTIHKGRIVADVEVLLEDLRRRGDRQHPFLAVVESTRRPRAP
ncbi:MAG: peptidase [Planctomycetaceae bacterium]